MTILKTASVATVVALMLGVIASVLPFTVGAYSAPNCVFNTIVQPHNAGGTTLSWKVYNAHTITISGGVGTVSDADSIVVYPSSVTDYTLTATGNGGVNTCKVTVQPVSAYPNIGNVGYGYWNNNQDVRTCSLAVSPDYVVPGGTAVLTWSAPGASYVEIDHGIGNLSNQGTRVVPNIGVPQTFNMIAKWGNGTSGIQRTCSATVRPTGPIAAPTFSGGINIPGAFVAQTPGVTLPVPVYTYPTAYPTPSAPHVTAVYTPPTTAYISINQVPYTGTNGFAYVLALLTLALGAFTLLYARRKSIKSAFASL